MDYEEKNSIHEAYIIRSLNSQKGWSRKGGPHRHLNLDEQLELAKLRADVHLYLAEHPAPRRVNPEMPF